MASEAQPKPKVEFHQCMRCDGRVRAHPATNMCCDCWCQDSIDYDSDKIYEPVISDDDYYAARTKDEIRSKAMNIATLERHAYVWHSLDALEEIKRREKKTESKPAPAPPAAWDWGVIASNPNIKIDINVNSSKPWNWDAIALLSPPLPPSTTAEPQPAPAPPPPPAWLTSTPTHAPHP